VHRSEHSEAGRSLVWQYSADESARPAQVPAFGGERNSTSILNGAGELRRVGVMTCDHRAATVGCSPSAHL